MRCRTLEETQLQLLPVSSSSEEEQQQQEHGALPASASGVVGDDEPLVHGPNGFSVRVADQMEEIEAQAAGPAAEAAQEAPSCSSQLQLTTYEDFVMQHQQQQQQLQQSSSTEDSSSMAIVKGSRPSSTGIGSECSTDSYSPYPSQDISCLSWGNWYSLSDLQISTDGFSPSNVIGEGGYAVVYRGQFHDGTMVAIKYLTNKSQKEFLVEVETIGRVRHKNLIKLLGYCAEGDHRLLVYEYVNNGNLEEWLHGSTSKMHTPSWDSRMKVILGTAKGLAYLHEALEPKIIHRDIKASNILLDSRWNAKVADFGLAKFLGSERTHVMTRVMGTFGYVAPEYASTGLLNDRSDVYSFGVLLMEVVTGRDPVDYSRPPGEVNLVDWLKLMLSNRRLDEVVDHRLEEKPSPRALKKALLTALQCVHPDVSKRPSMGHIVHILEAESFHLPDNWKNVKDSGLSKLIESQKQHQMQHQMQLNFTKELQSCKLSDYQNAPRTRKRMALYEA